MHTPARSLVAVGIDVAKATLRICLRFDHGTDRILSIGNVEPDLTSLVEDHLRDFRGKIVMESTGHYHWLAALTLTDAGADVRVINPLLARKYIRSNIRKVKNDTADAKVLAEIALREEHLPPPFAMDRNGLALRKQCNAIASFTKTLQRLEASLDSVEEAGATLTGTVPLPAVAGIRGAADVLRVKIKALEREFERAALAHDRERIERLASIPGVSTLTAAIVTHWCRALPEQTVKSWVAFAGMDISVRQSGQWQGRGKLTKRGNAYLRKRLYHAAWGAVMNDVRFKTAYDQLVENGRAHVEALNIIARKIMRTMFMLERTERPYDPTLAFAAT